jgi:hypothetical protein
MNRSSVVVSSKRICMRMKCSLRQEVIPFAIPAMSGFFGHLHSPIKMA